MKLNLTYREHIALQILPAFAEKYLAKDAVWRAFGVANEFLKQSGKFREIDEANGHTELAAICTAHMAEAMLNFCERVERGEVRSKCTYAEFCALRDGEPKK